MHGPDGPTRQDAGSAAVVLARAQMPDGRWAILLAWPRDWMRLNPPHQTDKAEHGWYLYEAHRVEPKRAPRTRFEGACWHGRHEDSQFNIAVREAVASLPEHLREAAAKPAPEQSVG